MKISLIAPLRNQKKAIGRFLEEVPRQFVDEIILIDIGSTDDSRKEAKKHLKFKDKIIRQKGKGWGGIYMEGMDLATGSFTILMETDGSHDPNDIPKLVDKAERGYNFVIASRYARGGKGFDDAWLRWFGNRMFTWLTNTLHGTNVTDALFSYYGITKEGWKELNMTSRGHEFGIELLVKAHRAGLNFSEVATIERPRFDKKNSFNILLHAITILNRIIRRYKE